MEVATGKPLKFFLMSVPLKWEGVKAVPFKEKEKIGPTAKFRLPLRSRRGD